MKKGATIWLIVYAMMMLSYGAVEMTHDFLHYLADHHHSHIHDHDHDDHHHVHDHQKKASHHHHLDHHHHHEEESRTEISSLVNFFLFTQRSPSFRFSNAENIRLRIFSVSAYPDFIINPSTPPPERVTS